ncbi:MAG: hypothetical protein JSW62_03650 [Thermoplasmatales archaeon]|nr:MAG: hypothetical protein JSW62_03650 [Thermoplasmatales archaeon]
MKYRKKQMIVVATVIVISFLILSGILIYFDIFEKKEILIEEEYPTFEIDERISPLTNLAISLEIHRIRKKGFEEIIRKPGISWKKKPSFRYTVFLHDAEFEGHTINSWDTGYVGWELTRDVDDSEKTSKIELTIYEPRKNLFKTYEKEVSNFEIVYNFKTGRWKGDDSFNDRDGYGHFNGDKYEIWFDVHQKDLDGDGIPYWTEVNVLRTDPKIDDSELDPDGDGVPTTWEWKWGYNHTSFDHHSFLDPDKDGIENSEEYMLEKWQANPYQPEIYIEVDFMNGKLFESDYMFWKESQQLLIDKFSQRKYKALNYSNSITVHIDDGCMGGGGEVLDHVGFYIDQESGIVSEFYKYHFDDERKGTFRYMVMAYDAGWAHPQDFKGWYDVICVGSSLDFHTDWTRGRNWGPRIRRIVQAIQVMHEIGHTCNLMPEYCQGIDNTSNEAITYWKNYQSCMNYRWMYRRNLYTVLLGKDYKGLMLDYSDGSRNEPNRPDCDDWAQLDISFFQRSSPLVEGIEK